MQLVEGRIEIDDLDEFLGRLDSIGDEYDSAIQAFDARYVAGREHLAVAVDRANRAFERGDEIAEDRAVEILCYAAGRRQIRRALEMGVSEGETAVAVVVDGGGEDAAVAEVRDLLEPEETVPDAGDPDLIREFFGIGDEELEATDATLEDLVIERVSLLVVEK